MLSVTPTFYKLWMLCSSLTELTASPLRERSKRAHKWTKAGAVTPFTANHWLNSNSQALWGIVVCFAFIFRQWASFVLNVFFALERKLGEATIHSNMLENSL